MLTATNSKQTVPAPAKVMRANNAFSERHPENEKMSLFLKNGCFLHLLSLGRQTFSRGK
jgi:hypothetical protein